MFMPNLDPGVVQSRMNAMKAQDYYLREGHDVFVFENEDGGAFAITREMGLDSYLRSTGCTLRAWTSPRLFAHENSIWSEQIGKA